MSRKVVHVKKDRYDVYVGRGKRSAWGNPFRIGVDGDRHEVIEKYKQWITKGDGRRLLVRLGELEGKTLGCWCAPSGGLTADDDMLCHGQILLKLLEHRRRKILEKRNESKKTQSQHTTTATVVRLQYDSYDDLGLGRFSQVIENGGLPSAQAARLARQFNESAEQAGSLAHYVVVTQSC